MALIWIWVDFERSLAEAILPFGGTQPSARLRRDGVLPCKVVITSTYALPRNPKGFPMVKTSRTLNAQWSTRVRGDGVGASENPRKLKQENETHWPHKYP